REEHGLETLLDGSELLLLLLDFLAQGAEVAAEMLQGGGFLLRRALHLVVGRVALRLERLERDMERAAFGHQRTEVTELEIPAARGEALHHRVEVVLKLLGVQHDRRASTMLPRGQRYLDR